MNQDLTVGDPRKVLWRFCLPLFASVIFQQLYNIADSFVAGKFISNDALAAVGNSYEITLIFIAFAFGCNIGCSVIVSKYFGAKKYGVIRTAVCTTLISGAVLCAVLMLAGLLSAEKLLDLIRTPDGIFADSALYLRIYIIGLPFVFFYNIATGIFSALGDSRTPFFFLVASSISNIAVDVLFVACFSMGVAGVAWATFLCQGISCILAMLFVLNRLRGLPSAEKAPLFSVPVLREIAVVAVPSILQQSFISVGNILIQGVINGFGESVIAGYAAAVKLNNMLITALTTLANGISNYSSQNLGAGQYARIRKGFFIGIRMVYVICLPVAFLYFFFGKYPIWLFLESPTGAAMDAGVSFLHIISPFYFVVSVKLISDGILRGVGAMKEFMVGTFTDLILRVLFSFFLSATVLGSDGIWLSWPVGWSISTVISLCFLSKCRYFKKDALPSMK